IAIVLQKGTEGSAANGSVLQMQKANNGRPQMRKANAGMQNPGAGNKIGNDMRANGTGSRNADGQNKTGTNGKIEQHRNFRVIATDERQKEEISRSAILGLFGTADRKAGNGSKGENGFGAGVISNAGKKYAPILRVDESGRRNNLNSVQAKKPVMDREGIARLAREKSAYLLAGNNMAQAKEIATGMKNAKNAIVEAFSALRSGKEVPVEALGKISDMVGRLEAAVEKIGDERIKFWAKRTVGGLRDAFEKLKADAAKIKKDGNKENDNSEKEKGGMKNKSDEAEEKKKAGKISGKKEEENAGAQIEEKNNAGKTGKKKEEKNILEKMGAKNGADKIAELNVQKEPEIHLNGKINSAGKEKLLESRENRLKTLREKRKRGKIAGRIGFENKNPRKKEKKPEKAAA
ncbi:MAG: hypothetical protein V1822_02890, partial [Candidatus Micrarchaeota archaeon]